MTVVRPSMEMIAMTPGFQWTFSFSLWVLPTWLSKNDSLPALVEFEFAMTLKVMEGNVSLNVNMGSTSQMVHEQMRGSVGRWWTALRQLQDASYWAEDGSSANWEHPQQEYGVGFRPCPPCLRVQDAAVLCGHSENQSDPPEGLMASSGIVTTSHPS